MQTYWQTDKAHIHIALFFFQPAFRDGSDRVESGGAGSGQEKKKEEKMRDSREEEEGEEQTEEDIGSRQLLQTKETFFVILEHKDMQANVPPLETMF